MYDMTIEEREDLIFNGHFTDEDWFRETDIDRLLFMALNWRRINGIWSEVAEEKMNLVKTCPLDPNEKYLLKMIYGDEEIE